MTDIKHADLIRAVLDGKTVQGWSPAGSWQDLPPSSLTIDYLNNFSNYTDFRLKPESVVLWIPVVSNYGYPYAHSSCLEMDVAARVKSATHILRIELDPETLRVISAETEKP